MWPTLNGWLFQDFPICLWPNDNQGGGVCLRGGKGGGVCLRGGKTGILGKKRG